MIGTVRRKSHCRTQSISCPPPFCAGRADLPRVHHVQLGDQLRLPLCNQISLPTAGFPITDYCESLNRGKYESCDAPCAGQVYDGVFSAGNAVGKLQVDCDVGSPLRINPDRFGSCVLGLCVRVSCAAVVATRSPPCRCRGGRVFLYFYGPFRSFQYSFRCAAGDGRDRACDPERHVRKVGLHRP
jgi:hypothetical protein